MNKPTDQCIKNEHPETTVEERLRRAFLEENSNIRNLMSCPLENYSQVAYTVPVDLRHLGRLSSDMLRCYFRDIRVAATKMNRFVQVYEEFDGAVNLVVRCIPQFDPVKELPLAPTLAQSLEQCSK